MPRDYKQYLEDILRAIDSIESFTSGMDQTSFAKNDLVTSAVLRKLEIIGEGAKQIPNHLRDQYPQAEWRKIAGLRDIISHAYFEVSLEIIWDVIENKLPTLKEIVSSMLNAQ